MLEQNRLVYEFDRYRLDAGDRLLYRNGEPVPLPPKVIDTLLVLVERHGRVVEKAVLIATVWPDVTVEENNLTQNVSLLRKTLGDGDDRKFIETIPRRGYRFVAPVKIVEEAPGTPPVTHTERRRLWLGAALLILILTLIAGVALAWRGARSPASGPTLRQLTTNSSELPLLFGAISPDGNSLVYVDGAGHHLKSIRTGETRLLPVPPEASGMAVRWFADGARLLLSTGSIQDPGKGIWTFSLHDNAAQRISNGGTLAAPSPDGSRICYLAADGRELWWMTASGQSPQRILSLKPGENLSAPVWTPSGDRIAYAYPHPSGPGGKNTLQMEVGSVDLQGQQVATMPFDPAITGGALLPGGRFLYALRRAPFSDWGESMLWEREYAPGFRELRARPRRVAPLGAGAEAYDFSATSDGRKLVFLKGEPQGDVYIAELADNRTHLSNVRRLTLDDHNDYLTVWSPDSRAVFFGSDRNGNFDVYRQFIDQPIAQPITAGSGDKIGVTIDPDGAWYYYAVFPEGWRTKVVRPYAWMRMPSAGGAPQAVFDRPLVGGIYCAIPAHVCVLVEFQSDEMAVYSFDREKGRGAELGRIKIGIRHQLDLSPDGTRVAVISDNRIRILELASRRTEGVSPPGWKRFGRFSWAPDGKGLYAVGGAPGRTVIFHMDFQGHVWPLYEVADEFDAHVAPSPDGRRLALGLRTSTRNAWMVEGF